MYTTVKQRGFNLNNLKDNYVNSVDLHVCKAGRDSSVDIATGYGRDGPGIESRLVRDFPHRSRPALGSTQPPVQWAMGLARG